jgi:imidazoleglycerol-phosphate dehydratase
MRTSTIERATKETNIRLELNLDGKGEYSIDTGSGFLNHMLELFAAHSRFDLRVKCQGDTQVDYHHSVEDIGIVLGSALKDALGDKRGIKRYANICLPMDEALAQVALDISGRSFLNYTVSFLTEKVGDFDVELVEEFMQGVSRSAGITLHIQTLAGKNSHHIIEAIFKAFARCLREAVSIDSAAADKIPSTKGTL